MTSPRKDYASLHELHREVNINMSDELPEQEIIFHYLDRNSRGVLEFGGNIGRSSIVINKLLKDPTHHVVFESDPLTAKVLEDNKQSNDCYFTIIPAALSDHSLVQKGWATRMYDSHLLEDGWQVVPTLSYHEFKQQFPIPFDTLVVDCEGALASILLEHGVDLLQSINTIIIEHDDQLNPHVPQQVIRPYLIENGFESIYHRNHFDIEYFYEVLKRGSGSSQ